MITVRTKVNVANLNANATKQFSNISVLAVLKVGNLEIRKFLIRRYTQLISGRLLKCPYNTH